jgi:hypothetical protein
MLKMKTSKRNQRPATHAPYLFEGTGKTQEANASSGERSRQ